MGAAEDSRAFGCFARESQRVAAEATDRAKPPRSRPGSPRLPEPGRRRRRASGAAGPVLGDASRAMLPRREPCGALAPEREAWTSLEIPLERRRLPGGQRRLRKLRWILRRRHDLRDPPQCRRMHRDVAGFTATSQGFAAMSEDLPQCLGLHRDICGFIATSRDLPQCLETHRNIWGCTAMSRD